MLDRVNSRHTSQNWLPSKDKIQNFTDISFVNVENLKSESQSTVYARNPHGFSLGQKEEFIQEYSEYELFCRIGNKEFLISYIKRFRRLLDDYENDPENIDIFKAILSYIISFHTLQLLYPSILLELFSSDYRNSNQFNEVQQFCKSDRFIGLAQRCDTLSIMDHLFNNFFIEDDELRAKKGEILIQMILKDRGNIILRNAFEKYIDANSGDTKECWLLFSKYLYSGMDDFLNLFSTLNIKVDNKFLKIFILLMEYVEGAKGTRAFYEMLSSKLNSLVTNTDSSEITDSKLQSKLYNCHIIFQSLGLVDIDSNRISLIDNVDLFIIGESKKIKSNKFNSLQHLIKILSDSNKLNLLVSDSQGLVHDIKNSISGFELLDNYKILDNFLRQMEYKFDAKLFAHFLYFVANCISGAKLSYEIVVHGFMLERIMRILENNINKLGKIKLYNSNSLYIISYFYLCDFSSQISPELFGLLREGFEDLSPRDPGFIKYYFEKDPSGCIGIFENQSIHQSFPSKRLILPSYELLQAKSVDYEEYKRTFLKYFLVNESSLLLDYIRGSDNGHEYVYGRLSKLIYSFLTKTLEILGKERTLLEMISLIERLGMYDAFVDFFINLLKEDTFIINQWDQKTRKNVLQLLQRTSLQSSNNPNSSNHLDDREFLLSVIYLKNREYTQAKYHYDLLSEDKKRLIKDDIERLRSELEVQIRDIITDLVQILYIDGGFSDDASERENSKKHKYSRREFLIQIRSYLNDEQNSFSDNSILEIAEEVFLREEQNERRSLGGKSSSIDMNSGVDPQRTLREKLLTGKVLEKLGVFALDFYLPKHDLEYQPGLLTRENGLVCIPDFHFGDHYGDFKLGNFTENIRETIEKILSFSHHGMNRDIPKRVGKILIIHFNGIERIASLQEEYRETVKFIPFDTILLRLENSQLHGPLRRELRKKKEVEARKGLEKKGNYLIKNASLLKSRPIFKEIISSDTQQLLNEGIDIEDILLIFEKEINSRLGRNGVKWNKVEYSFMRGQNLQEFRQNLDHYQSVFFDICKEQIHINQSHQINLEDNEDIQVVNNLEPGTPLYNKVHFYRNLRMLYQCIYSKRLEVEKLKHLEGLIWFMYKNYGLAHNGILKQALKKYSSKGKISTHDDIYKRLEIILAYANDSISLDTILGSDLFEDYKKIAGLNGGFYRIETEGKYLHHDTMGQYVYSDILSRGDFSNPYEKARKGKQKTTVNPANSKDYSRNSVPHSVDVEKYNPIDEEKVIGYNLELAIQELEINSGNQTIAFSLDSIVSAFQELYVTHEINKLTGEMQVCMKWEEYVNHVKQRNHEKQKTTYDHDMSKLQILRKLLRDLLRKSPRFYEFSEKNMWSIDYTVGWAQRKYGNGLLDENMRHKLTWKIAMIEGDKMKKNDIGDSL